MADAKTAYRSPGGEARVVRELVFDELPAVVRDRLTTSLVRGGAPAPLISAAGSRRWASRRLWIGLALGLAFVDVLLWFVGFGDRLEAPPLSPLALALGHAASLALMLFALLRAARLKHVQRGVPYPAGRHLFELDLVEVDGPRVRVTALDSLRHIAATMSEEGRKKQGITLRFADGHEVVFSDQSDAEGLAASALAAVKAARELVLTDDQARMERIDPFFALRVTNDWSSAASQEGQSPPPLFVRASLATVAAACLLAGAAFGAVMLPVGRQHLVALDDARFEEAQAEPLYLRIGALKTYVSRGGRHADQAMDTLFELQKGDARVMADFMERGGARAAEAERALRASTDTNGLIVLLESQGQAIEIADDRLFELARKAGTSEAFGAYIRQANRHRKEAEALQYEAAYAVLGRGQGSAGALFDHLKEYPQAAHSSEVRARLQALYDTALQSHAAEKRPGKAEQRFLEALVANLIERHDPLVRLTVKVSENPAIAATDRALAEREGEAYLPAAPHVKGLGAMERAVHDQLADWLIHTFPGGLARTIRTERDDRDESQRPTVEVTCTPVAAAALEGGSSKVTQIRFEIAFRAGTAALPAQLEWSDITDANDEVALRDLLTKAPVTDAASREALGQKVYRRMIERGSLQVQKRIADRL